MLAVGFLIFGALWYVGAPGLQALIQWIGSPQTQRFAEFPYVLRTPATALFISVAGLFGATDAVSWIASKAPSFIPPDAFDDLSVAALFLLRALVGLALWFCIYRCMELIRTEFVERTLNKYGRARERNAVRLGYYMLLPIAFGGVIIFVGYLFDLHVETALVAAGSIGVAAAFALQHVLANIFAGFTLALDTSFTEKDLIKVGSDKLYEVIKRGIRITTVRDIETHEIAYLPNQTLLTQTIVDVTRPTDDLRAAIRVSVPYNCNLREVRAILSDIALGHPHVIGPFEAKQKAIKAKVYRLYLRKIPNECKEHYIDLARLKAEDDLNTAIRDLRSRLDSWVMFIDKHEDQGFDADERRWLNAFAVELDNGINEIRVRTTKWMILFRNSIAKGRQIVFHPWGGNVLNEPWKADPKLIEEMAGEMLVKSGLKVSLAIWQPESKAKLEDHNTDAAKMEELSKDLDKLYEKLAKRPDASSNGQDSSSTRSKDILDFVQGMKTLSKLEEHGMLRKKWTGGEETKVDYVGHKLKWLSAALKGAREQFTKFESEFGYLRDSFQPAVLGDTERYKTLPGGDEANSTAELWSRAQPYKYDMKGYAPADGYWCYKTRSAGAANADVDQEKFGKPYLDVIEYIHTAFELADFFSRLANTPPERKELKDQYLDAQNEENEITDSYDALGQIYVKVMSDAAEWIARHEKPINSDLAKAQEREVHAKSGVSIALCKTRTEDAYIGSKAIAHFIDHPLLQALAGQIIDDDERAGVAEVFRIWGDKLESLLQRQRHIVAKLKEARSTTIDSDLQELSTWLKSDFKEPFPTWKYPLAPIEHFEDSGITVSMKFYVDNVRMEKYLRSFNAFTQIRLRISERLNNAGIAIPFPQRDLNFPGAVSVTLVDSKPAEKVAQKSTPKSD